ncbi:MAG: transcriptional regulator GcvA [Alphaproteobacteria bacterium]|nr:transcriptional regulator GcvA [Alphaproteobacteria bacterium]
MEELHRLPSLDALLTFHEVARRKSFTKAARALSVTQGAVSHRIKGLEAHLGQPLLHRTSRRVELTDAGRLLADACEGALDQLEDALRQLILLSDTARLVVSCSPSFAIRWLVPHLPELQAAHPGLDVRISADDRRVRPGRDGIDVCIRYGPGGAVGVDELRLSVEEVTPVCSPALRERLRTPADLARHTLLHDEVLHGHPGRVGWRRWLDEAGVQGVDPDHGVRFSHAHMAVEAAIAGQGVALARGILVAADLASGRLVAPFDLHVESGLAYWVLTPRGGVLRAPVRAFREWLVGAVAGGALPVRG